MSDTDAPARWCPECGAEYTATATTCADCNVALVDRPPDEREVTGALVYELGDWSSEQRGALEQRLQGEGIEHQWETAEGLDVEFRYETTPAWDYATDLVVGESHEERVDELIDEIEHPEALDEEADDGSDEAVYEVMSNLYVVADRLKDDPGDLALAGDFFDAADEARDMPPPYGIDAAVWQRVQSLAAEVTAALEAEADDDVVGAHARSLRDLLFQYV